MSLITCINLCIWEHRLQECAGEMLTPSLVLGAAAMFLCGGPFGSQWALLAAEKGNWPFKWLSCVCPALCPS